MFVIISRCYVNYGSCWTSCYISVYVIIIVIHLPKYLMWLNLIMIILYSFGIGLII